MPTPATLPAIAPRLRSLAADRTAALVRSASGLALPPPSQWPGDVERVLACSDFVYRACERSPALLAALLHDGLEHPTQALEDDLRVRIGTDQEEDAFYAALRSARQYHMVRIAWRDIGGLAGFESAVRETSDFADTIIALALEWLEARLVHRHGEPESAQGVRQHLVVYGLGKLGAHELNFSSDVDLIFAYPNTGHTRASRRQFSNQEFFSRLGQQLVQALGNRTEHGFVFRVDMRLRPFGRSGPLAMSFDAMEDYYQVHGRDWERYALIRARTIAGDRAQGDAMLGRLQPFVYRRYFDFGALESLRAMKAMIDGEVARRGLANHLKLGPGGIREIEFTGQAFQMVRGGRQPKLRTGQILSVLERLGEEDLLSEQVIRDLSEAYRFLRNSEHRLQQVDDRQTHTLPEDEEGRARLACAMGFASWPDYARQLAHYRGKVREQFDQVLGGGGDDSGDASDVVAAEPLRGLWLDGTSDADAVALLAEAGFEHAEEALERVRAFFAASGIRLIDRTGRQRLERLLPNLLRACAQRSAGVTTLERALTIAEAIARRSTYIALLAERPLALSQLVKLCAASPWIARQIAAHPILLDELLDARTLYAPLDAAALATDLQTRLANVSAGDTEDEMDCLRQFKQSNVLRVAAADVARTIPLMVVSDYLTAIAETALGGALALARRDLEARYGAPRMRIDGATKGAPFAVIAYGKLGGIELGYASDLDLVFIHGSEGREQQTAGPRVVDNARFFDRLAQRIVHVLSTLTSQGKLYEVDLRLRPSGGAGLLVNSIAGLETYLREDAWTWEHQALVRARAVAGDASLMARFAELRQRILLTPRDPEKLQRQVREMRMRMRRELGSGDRPGFDLKQDPGGIADIEFMVQYGALCWASRLGSYLDFPDNIRLLEGFAACGLLPRADCTLLGDAYRTYRARLHAMALQEQEGPVGGTEFAELRAAVSALWLRLMDDTRD